MIKERNLDLSELPQIIKQEQVEDELHDVIQIAAAAACADLIVYDNFTVFALVGDANNPNLQERIRSVKGDRRNPTQPVGWTVPFAHGIEAIDSSLVLDKDLRRFIEDPNYLTARLGGLAFLRAGADQAIKEKRDIPDCIIPNELGSMVQIYSPEGNSRTSMLVSEIQKRGGEPIMTSANLSRHVEIINYDEAISFAQARSDDLLLMVNKTDSEKPLKPHGSYPVLEVDTDAIIPTRPGWMGVDIIKNLLYGLPVEESLDSFLQKPNHPEHVLTTADLPRDMQGLKGPELRLGILSVMGVSGT
jgi:hypothetical protein